MFEKLKQFIKEHRKNKAFNVEELAEELQLFPSDVEMTVKILQAKGLVKCYMYKGKLYVVPEPNVDIRNALEEHNPMFA